MNQRWTDKLLAELDAETEAAMTGEDFETKARAVARLVVLLEEVSDRYAKALAGLAPALRASAVRA